MRKITFIFLLLLILLTNVYGFTPYQKPHPGLQINWANPLSKGLVGLWLFNEGSGNKVFDLSGNGNTLTAINSPVWGVSKFGGGLTFVSASSQVVRGDSPLTGYPRTIVVWVKVTTFGAFRRIIVVVDSNGDCSTIALGSGTGGNELIMAGEITRQDYIPMSLNVWHQLVGVFHSEPSVDVYVDAIQKPNTFAESELIQGNVPDGAISIGGRWDASFLDGIVNNASVYNRALSASEIAELYREPFGMFVKDDIAILVTAAVPPPAPSGQVITIQMSMISVIFALILIRRKLTGDSNGF